MRPAIEKLLSPIVHLSANLVSRIGVVLVTSSVVFWLFFLPTSIRGAGAHPYIGILEFLVIPGIFFAGLAMIPVGMWLRWRHERKRGVARASTFPLRLDSAELRHLGIFVGVTTVINLALGALFTYQAVGYMDSVGFCGRACHQVMQPEYTAYQNSPHSRVECVACHIGPGASWFVRSKLSGVGQVFAVTFDTYPRPIPTPVHNLRPARETCETCHWPQRYGGDRLRIIDNYADDEANTHTKTVLLMRIGGGYAGAGIHGVHLGRGVEIHYWPSDESRQTIPRVEYSNSVTGQSAVYTEAGVKPETLQNLPARLMDCMDCHNRPTHTFSLPTHAVDDALASGAIPVSLPFIKKHGVELLQKAYASREQAVQAIPAELARLYPGRSQAEVAKAAKGLVAIYDRNVFPDMKVTWGTYPNNIGHMDFPGCFRCHDGNHSTTGGKVLTQDCSVCHQLLAVQEPNPKILSDLGLE